MVIAYEILRYKRAFA
jgi:hypothetical protein